MFDFVRSSGKKILGRSPKGYKIGQAVFNYVKIASDRIVFGKRYPQAEYVSYDDSTVKGFLEEGYGSQYGQDWYLWNKMFLKKKGGVFVDIGGNDPIELSNSLFLERQGWSGYAFDPLERAATAWSEHRSATFHHAAISDKQEVRDFVEIRTHDGWEHAMSGFDGFVRDEDMARYGYRKYPVAAAPLDTFIPEGTAIDIIMIDVEGAENIVLDGIDMDRLKPSFVMIENVSAIGGGEEIRHKMFRSGYAIVARIGSADDLFKRI